MQESIVDDTISRMRADNREELSIQRKKDRQDALMQRRMKLFEAEALGTNITLEQFQELVLQSVKLRKPPVEIFKVIKNNCHSPAYTEVFLKTQGALDCLVRTLTSQDAHLQLEAAACLTNLACGSHKASQKVYKSCGAYLVCFISDRKNFYLQDQCAWAAGNIANDCFECYSKLKNLEILPALLTAIQSPSSDVIQSAVYALHACTKYGDPDSIEVATPETSKLLLEFVKQENIPPNTRSDAAFTLANICHLLVQNNAHIDFDLSEPILCLLSSVISSRNMDVSIALPLVRCLGFLSVSDAICQYLSQHPSFYSIVTPLLSDKILRKEILWALTNIVAISNREIPDFHIVLKIVDFLNPVDPFTLQVLYFLCVLASQSENMKTLLQHPNIILKISLLLQSGEKSINNASECFCKILQIDL